MRTLAFVAILLIAWDAVLHFVGLVARDETSNLPWILWPTFSSWVAYDLFWMMLHALAAIILLIRIR